MARAGRARLTWMDLSINDRVLVIIPGSDYYGLYGQIEAGSTGTGFTRSRTSA